MDNRADLLQTELTDEPIYVPQTKESRALYEQLLKLVSDKLGDQTQDVLVDVANEILAILKTDDLKAEEKKKELEAIFPVNEGLFTKMLAMSKELKDYTIGLRAPVSEVLQEHVMAIDLDKEVEAEQEEGEGLQGEVEEGSEDYDAQMDPDGEKDIEDEDQGGEQAEEKLDWASIDSTWLEKTLSEVWNDSEERRRKEEQILMALSLDSEIECQNRLFEIFDQDNFMLVGLLHENRFPIYYLTKLARAKESDKKRLIEEMKADPHGREVYDHIQNLDQNKGSEDTLSLNLMKDATNLKKLAQESRREKEKLLELKDDEGFAKLAKSVLNLSDLELPQGVGLVGPESCKLPKGSFKQSFPGYEEVFVPPKTQAKKHIALKKIEELPVWAQTAFPETKSLNVIQSVVYDCAFKSAENMLICAPTGAGKTNIALLSILQLVGSHMDEKGRIDISKFKAVYIAPMKALVSEIVGALSRRLGSMGLTVKELTGDAQLSRAELEEAQVIVATPEKWDIVTRKAGDKFFLDQVQLLIIDEIHLLHDSRGPVLESIVARTIRHTELSGNHIRLIGLSATLPNYQDVADFLRVQSTGLFFFDATYRPIPLEQLYVGITDKKGLKKMLLMKEILYQKVMERIGKQQILIFVHSRRETSKTAKEIRDQAYANDDLAKFIREDSASKAVLTAEAENCKNADLKELLPLGIAIHHAGLSREDRTLVEDLYADKHIQLLISTATLAWGVNLPAKTVIIKGTQVYSPEKGKWVELSPQDLLQMLGRGGRPTFDTSGEGIILTGYNELKYYLSLANNQLPIESQFITQLADQLNAEVVLGTVTRIKEGVEWLGYTYLFVRMLRTPRVYGVPVQELEGDPLLVQRRADLIHSAALLLEKHHLVKYDRKSGEIQPTTLGRIASHFYIKHSSMAVYNEHLRSSSNLMDLLRIFSLSSEFKYIPVRDSEKGELEKMLSSVPVPVRGGREDPSSKVNVLLQAHISRMKLDGYALNSDMVYVTQSAGRILRGLFEVCIRRGWASVAETSLALCLMVDRRQWGCMSPLRQYPGLQEKALRRIENQEHLTWEHLHAMTVPQLANLLKHDRLANLVHKLVRELPRVEAQVFVQPLSRSSLRVELTLKSAFDWNDSLHGNAQPFWLFITDVDNEILLHYQPFLMYKSTTSLMFEVTIPLLQPLNPQYFVKILSDRWLQSSTQIPISFKNLILPAKFPPTLELEDQRPLTKDYFTDSPVKKLLSKLKITTMNGIQTQIMDTVYNTFDSYLLTAPCNSGKTVCFLLSASRLFIEDTKKNAKILIVLPFKDLLMRRKKAMQILADCFDRTLGVLTGNTAPDLQTVEKSHIILSTAEQWDNLSRRWRTRKATQDLRMVLLDHIHMLGENTSAYEVIASRIRFMFAETEKQVRIVATGISIANSRDISEWLGIRNENVFNFHPKVRPISLEAVVNGFDQAEPNMRFFAMTRQLFQDLQRHSPKKPVIIFVSDKKNARLTAAHLNNYAAASKINFLGTNTSEQSSMLTQAIQNLSDLYLKFFLQSGIGFMFEGMSQNHFDLVLELYKLGIIHVLVLTHSLAWTIDARAYTVAILDTKYFHEQRLVDYPLPELHEMLGKAGRPGVDTSSTALIYVYNPGKEGLKKFLFDPVPVESQLHHSLAEHLNAEIATKGIETKQDCMDWLGWTCYYRRIQQNPNYYNLIGVSEIEKSEHLSEQIENAIAELVEGECLFVQEEEEGRLVPINAGMIAAHYYLRVSTVSLFVKHVKESAKWKQLLELLSNASEFEALSLRQDEDNVLRQLFPDVRHKPTKPVFTELSIKINMLLQLHFERKSLPSDLSHDQQTVLTITSKLVQALVDCIGYNSWLKPAIMAMKISQMLVQGLWVTDSPLLQLPHFTTDLVKKCNDKGINTIGKLSCDFRRFDGDGRRR